LPKIATNFHKLTQFLFDNDLRIFLSRIFHLNDEDDREI